MSGRPHYYDTAMEATISTKISQEENEELNRLVRVSGVSKSDIIRSALTIILKHVRESYAVSKDVQKLLNEKRFSIQAIEVMLEKQKKSLERDLNGMAYKKVLESAKERENKTDSPSE
mgnify:FL=1